MPRISIENYDTVASWNGSQDLFVVEQPDGTKVATPAMVKQFIEAGDFEATGEITDGHGNILADMAKSADVATALAGKQDTLTFDNVPTQNSNNPVKSGGIKSSIDDKAKRLNNIKIIDENFEIRFIGFSDVANRILCPIFFPFAFANNDYTLECTLLDLASVGSFTTGFSVSGKDRSSALIILSKTSSAGAVYCGIANIHISRTE